MARGRTNSRGRGRGNGKNAKVVEEVESAASVGRSGEEVIVSVDGVDELEEEIEEMADEEIGAEIEESLGVNLWQKLKKAEEVGFPSSANQKSIEESLGVNIGQKLKKAEEVGFPSLANQKSIEESLGVNLGQKLKKAEEVGFPSSANQKSNIGEVSKPESDWRGLFQAENAGVSLQYFEPEVIDGKVVVEPPYEVIEEGIFKWSSSLVGQFLDKPFHYYHVKKAVDIIWKQFGKVEVFLLDNGMYIFRFADEATRDEVLSARLWHISNKPLILRRWELGMQILKLSLNSIPIWIKLMHLPMEFWTPTCLSYVASGVGKPLYADSITGDQTRLGFARVLVEVHSDSTFPKEIVIRGAGGQLVSIGVEYPWIPVQCKNCKSFGHAAYSCYKVEKKIWVPKAPTTKNQKVEMKVQGVIPLVHNNEWKEISAPRTRKHKEGDMDGSSSSRGSPGNQVLINNTNKKVWSNSFEALRNKEDVEFEEGEIKSNRIAINAIQKIIGDVLNKEYPKLKLKTLKGEGQVDEENDHEGRGFSPTI
jgi:hypothetical protein